MYKVRAIFHHQVHSYHRIFKNHFRRRVKCPLTAHSLYGTDAGSQFGSMSTMLILIEVVCYVIWFSTDTSSSKISVDDIFFFFVGVLRSDHDLKCVMNACCCRQTTPTMSGALFFSLTCIALANLIGSITWNDKRAFYLHINGICYISVQITIHTYDKIYPNKIKVLKERDSHDANLWCFI